MSKSAMHSSARDRLFDICLCAARGNLIVREAANLHGRYSVARISFQRRVTAREKSMPKKKNAARETSRSRSGPRLQHEIAAGLATFSEGFVCHVMVARSRVPEWLGGTRR